MRKNISNFSFKKIAMVAVAMLVLVGGFFLLPPADELEKRVTPTPAVRRGIAPVAIAASPTATVALLWVPAGLIPTFSAEVIGVATAMAKATPTATATPAPAVAPTAAAGCGQLGPARGCYCSQQCNPNGSPVLVVPGSCVPCTPK